MAAEIFARLAIYLTQVGIALLLCVLLWNLNRIYQQGYIRSWFIALFGFTSYQLAILLQWALQLPLLMEPLQFVTIMGSYVFAVFLLRGMMLTRRNGAPRWASLSSITLVTLLATLSLLSLLPFQLFEIDRDWRDY